MIVTIDGPAGAGKSTVARHLAQRLGFAFLDTGAMYRAVTLAAQLRRLDLRDEAEMTALLADLQLEMAARGETVALADLLRAQEERDARDAARDIAPMKPAADALTVDTTHLTLAQVVERLETEVRCRIGSAAASTKPPTGPA